jgi:hypothetical protein
LHLIEAGKAVSTRPPLGVSSATFIYVIIIAVLIYFM